MHSYIVKSYYIGLHVLSQWSLFCDENDVYSGVCFVMKMMFTVESVLWWKTQFPLFDYINQH